MINRFIWKAHIYRALFKNRPWDLQCHARTISYIAMFLWCTSDYEICLLANHIATS